MTEVIADTPAVSTEVADAGEVSTEPVATEEAPVAGEEPESADENAPQEPAKPAVDTKLAPRFAELARREREITAKAAELKPKLEAAQQFETVRAKVKEDPFVALEALGITMPQLVDAVLRHGKPETVEDKVARLERERADEKKAADTQRAAMSQQQEKAVYDNFKQQITEFVNADPETYELTIARGAHTIIFDVIAEHFKATGNVLPVQDAAQMVENHFLEEYKSMSSLKKVASLGTKTEPVKPSPAKPGAKSAPPLSTSTTKATPTAKDPPKRETHEERIARIAKKIDEKKKANA